MAQQSFQYTLLLNKLTVSFSNTNRYCIFWSHHPTQNDGKCGFMSLFILQQKHAWTVTYFAFLQKLHWMLLSSESMWFKQQHKKINLAAVFCLYCEEKVISEVRKRQIQYPKEQIIKAGLGVLTEDMERTALLTRFCLPRLWVRQSLRLSLCIMGSAWIRRYSVWAECKNWLGAQPSALQENLCSWKVSVWSCL